MTGRDLLDRLLEPSPPPFALLHRPHSGTPGTLDVLTGTVASADSLAAIALPEPDGPAGEARHEVLALVPYRMVGERGFDAPDDGEPLLTLTVTGQGTVPVAEALDRIPDVPVRRDEGRFLPDDDAYADVVRRVVIDEIGTGKGANFVVKRSFVTRLEGFTPGAALAFFRRLLAGEQGAYWTFVIHTGDRTFVGATPERHITLDGDKAVMNPISGTYRYPATGPTLSGVMDFLADGKETDELYMVVDEELKMMARICPSGGRVVGPYLKEMARLAHTEYLIEGRTRMDVRDILRETMFAPTVTGSPLESACRVIARYEPEGRGYYSGVAALIGRDAHGDRALDSAILIRTADIDAQGEMRIGVGATLVRHSDPASEVAETRAKASGLLTALDQGGPVRLGAHPEVRAALSRRNEGIADFWLREHDARRAPEPALGGLRVLVVDAEDTFTAMIAHQLAALDLAVTVRRYDRPYAFEGHDLVVMGPGPGDPRDAGDPKIARLRASLGALLAERRPFLAVCLSHQVLSLLLGLDVVRREVPNQGVQRRIDLFGVPERVAFYNTFEARSDEDKKEVEGVGVVEVSRDAVTGEVHALRGRRFASMQFHAESVLTVDGPRIIGDALRGVLEP
ncbi:MAG TPA: anthranilate synthase family protein [Thermomonospora sp.]|nr:anthranilate synthase family protein [Thermomonospora sp.]